jgi:uncharacterized protein (TIGR03435 family)
MIKDFQLLKWTAYLLALSSAVAFGQPTTFEAASVKPVAQSDNRGRASMRGGPGTPDEGQITYTNVTLMNVLLRAYDVKTYQATGPDWMSSQRYDILAKIPPGTTKQQFGLMLQNLLTKRFHLALHHESREIQGYELVTGKNGPKLKLSADTGSGAPQTAAPSTPPPTDANGFPQLDRPGMLMMEGVRGTAVVSYLTARGQPVSALVDMLSREFRLPILDKTGLTGKFDFKLEFAPQPPGALPPSVEGLPDNMAESAPNLITAVQEQLGLKLNPNKVPTDVLIVDRADKVPTEN